MRSKNVVSQFLNPNVPKFDFAIGQNDDDVCREKKSR